MIEMRHLKQVAMEKKGVEQMRGWGKLHHNGKKITRGKAIEVKSFVLGKEVLT